MERSPITTANRYAELTRAGDFAASRSRMPSRVSPWGGLQRRRTVGVLALTALFWSALALQPQAVLAVAANEKTWIMLQYHGMLTPDLDYLGANDDQGGQLVYVLDEAKALAEETGDTVIIYARKINDTRFPKLSVSGDKHVIKGKRGKVEIRYLSFGPNDNGSRDKYIHKYQLWPYVNEFVDKVVKDVTGGKEPRSQWRINPYWIFGHYADGGVTAQMIAARLKTYYSFTPHSMGQPKYEAQRRNNEGTPEELNTRYEHTVRRAAEWVALRFASLITAGSPQERDTQLGGSWYDAAVKRARGGRKDPRFVLMPQGIGDLFDREQPFTTKDKAIATQFHQQWRKQIHKERYGKSALLFWSRFNAKKNPSGLVLEYAMNEELQAHDNLIIMCPDALNKAHGDAYAEHQKIQRMIKESKKGYITVPDPDGAKGATKRISVGDLTGKVAIVRVKGPLVGHHPGLTAVFRSIARLDPKTGAIGDKVRTGSAANRWIYVNPATLEPAGRMNFEAQYAGLVSASTDNGGPRDLVRPWAPGQKLPALGKGKTKGPTGLLFNVATLGDMGNQLLSFRQAGQKVYDYVQESGYRQVKNEYSWRVTLPKLIKRIAQVHQKKPPLPKLTDTPAFFRNPTPENKAALSHRFYPLVDTAYYQIEQTLRRKLSARPMQRALRRIIAPFRKPDPQQPSLREALQDMPGILELKERVACEIHAERRKAARRKQRPPSSTRQVEMTYSGVTMHAAIGLPPGRLPQARKGGKRGPLGPKALAEHLKIQNAVISTTRPDGTYLRVTLPGKPAQAPTLTILPAGTKGAPPSVSSHDLSPHSPKRRATAPRSARQL